LYTASSDWNSELGVVIPSKPLLRREGGESREVSRSLRHNNRVFGSLPYPTAATTEILQLTLVRPLQRARFESEPHVRQSQINQANGV